MAAITKSRIASVRVQNATNREIILALLEWDDLRYCEFQMNMGEEYLIRTIGSDTYGIEILVKSQLFWKWWINHWNKRDQIFILRFSNGSYPVELLRNEYHFEHNPTNLVMSPNKVILEESYGAMIQQLIDQERKEQLQ
jgi:hypothetical protein